MSLYFYKHKWRLNQTVKIKAGLAKATNKYGCPVDRNYEIRKDIEVKGNISIYDGKF